MTVEYQTGTHGRLPSRTFSFFLNLLILDDEEGKIDLVIL